MTITNLKQLIAAQAQQQAKPQTQDGTSVNSLRVNPQAQATQQLIKTK